jgi:GAF domain-containing protein
MKDLLTSWKEIATYLGRTPRTVQRWEKEFNLPVHRPPHKQSRLVIADTDELDTWAIDHTDCNDLETSSDVTTPNSHSLKNEILHEIARKESSSTVFAALTGFVEQALSCDFAEISLVDYRLRRWFHAAGPNVPKELLVAPAFFSLGNGFGSCAAVASTQKPALSVCIKSDPKWNNAKSLAVKHGLSSAWAQPIICNGRVVGIVAAYFRKRRRPTCDYLSVLELVSHVAAISLQMSGLTETLDEFEKDAGFIGIDSAFAIRAMNREAARILDSSVKELIGQNLWDLYPDASPLVRREYERALSEGIIVAFENVSNALGARFTIVARPSNDGLAIFFRQSVVKAAVAVA